jgi:hypothetical protein
MSYSEGNQHLTSSSKLPVRKVIPFYNCIYIYEGKSTENGVSVLVAVLQSYRICTEEELSSSKKGTKIFDRPNGKFVIDNTLAVRMRKDVLYDNIKDEILRTGSCKIRAMQSLFVNSRLVFMDESHLSPETARQITLRFFDSINFVIFSSESWDEPTLGLSEIFPDLINLDLIFDTF